MTVETGRHNEFDAVMMECLDALADGTRTVDECLAQYPAYASDMAPLLLLAGNLREAHELRPSLGFRKQARARMQQRIALSARPPLADTHRSRTQRIAAPKKRSLFGLPNFAVRAFIAEAVVAVLACATGVTAYAADSSTPGDTLYPVDTAVERVSLQLARSPERVLNLQLAIADERIEEAEMLIEAGSDDRANEALTAYDATVEEIVVTAQQVDPTHREEVQARVDKNFSKHIEKLNTLLDKVPEQARRGIERAIENSNKHRNNHSDSDGPGNSGNPGNGNGNSGGNGNGNGNGGAAPSNDEDEDDSDGFGVDGGQTDTADSGNRQSGSSNSGNSGNGTSNGNSNGNGNGSGNGNWNGQPGDKPKNGNGNGNKHSGNNDDQATPTETP